MNQRKKVVILTYWFPPCNLTASQRALGFARYLHQFGWDPVVITRNWDKPIVSAVDLSASSGTETRITQGEFYTLIELPYKASVRDKLITSQTRFLPWKVLQKLLTFLEIIFQYVSVRAVPYSNIYAYANEYLKKNKDEVHALLVTANPWIFFRFGYLLHKKHGIPWVADYRDDWTTRSFGHWYQRGKWMHFFGRKLEAYFEKKWVQSAYAFTSVSPAWVEKISRFTHTKGYLIYNGYFPEDFSGKAFGAFDAFTFCYCGTLLDMHKVEIVCEAVIQLAKKYQSQLKIQMYFAGAGFEKSAETRLNNLFSKNPEILRISGRISRADAIAAQMQSHVLVMLPYGDIIGAPSSKIFDYIATQKPVLLCPGDNDIMEEMLTQTGQAIVCHSAEEAVTRMSELIDTYLKDGTTGIRVNTQAIGAFRREQQVKKLSHLLAGISEQQ